LYLISAVIKPQSTFYLTMSANFTQLKVVDLKRELKNRGLVTTGNKEDLIERLNAYTTTLLGASTEIDGLSESMIDTEILDEDDVLKSDSDEADEEMFKKTDESALEESPIAIEKTPMTTLAVDAVVPSPVKKKIILKRKSGPSISSDSDGSKEPNTPEDGSLSAPSLETNGNVSGDKVIKLSAYSTEERLKMRAEKFGSSTNPASKDKLEERAIRFGLKPGSTASEPINEDAYLVTLKKRAERFGTVVSSALTKHMEDEKMEARKRRFNAAGGGSGDEDKSVDEAEKKRQRAERFGAEKSSTSATTVSVNEPATTDVTIEEKKRLRAERFGAATGSATTATNISDKTAEERKRLRAERFKLTS